MIIADILSEKGNCVEVMWPERTIAHVLARFDEHRISSVVITNHAGRPIGIVSDRDILRAITRRGSDGLRIGVTEVMQSPAPTCLATDTVVAIMQRMTFERIRHVAVVDGDGNLIGIVSIGDLLKSRLRDADLESRVLRDMALGRIASN